MPRSARAARLATVTIPAPDLRPEAFLCRARGDARGFWARDEGWVAHRGRVAVLEVADTDDASEGPTDRFARIAERARALAADPVLPRGAARAPRVRFFGGLSFREDHCATDVWRAFPRARFILPALELEGDASGDAWLKARALVDPAQGAAALERLRRRAQAVRAELSAAGEEGGDALVTVPARARSGPREEWTNAVLRALDAIREGRVAKAVLARTLDVALGSPIDPGEVAAALWRRNRGSHVFMFEPVAGAALTGAAPETIATLREGVFRATAVAGSVRRGRDPREQGELARRLLASAKDRAEQRITLEDMVARLETVARRIRADPEPHVLALADIQHLETEIRATVPPEVGLLDLVRLLHPTPAVCGRPREGALDLLAAREPFDRGWYAGPVGWFDAEGNGVMAPALRSGVCNGAEWRLFAGAGIVEGSDPDAEWDETGVKFAPMLDALRAAGARLETDPLEAEGTRTAGLA